MNTDTKKWVSTLTSAKDQLEKDKTNAPKISIGDLASLCQDPEYKGRLIPTTSHSIEAFLRLGIKPNSLVYLPYEHFLRRRGDAELVKVEYEYAEQLRQIRLERLVAERERLETEAAAPAATAVGNNTSSMASKNAADNEMVQREARRLELMKRRLQKELDQALEHERTRQELQSKAAQKIAALEKRAEEHKRAKMEASKAWQQQKREKEVQRKVAEEARQKQLKEQVDRQRTAELEAIERDKQRQEERKKEARRRDEELRRKALQVKEEARRAQLLQAEEAAIRRAEADAKQAARAAALGEKQQRAADERAANERVAKERAATAMAVSRTLEQQRREALERRKQQIEERAKVRKQQRAAELKQRHDKEEERLHQLQTACAIARNQETERVKELAREQDDKQAEIDAHHAAVALERKKKALIKRLELQEKIEAVEESRRREAYHQVQQVKMMDAAAQRTEQPLAKRDKLQKQRKFANFQASLQRQQMVEVIKKASQTGKAALSPTAASPLHDEPSSTAPLMPTYLV